MKCASIFYAHHMLVCIARKGILNIHHFKWIKYFVICMLTPFNEHQLNSCIQMLYLEYSCLGWCGEQVMDVPWKGWHVYRKVKQPTEVRACIHLL